MFSIPNSIARMISGCFQKETKEEGGGGTSPISELSQKERDQASALVDDINEEETLLLKSNIIMFNGYIHQTLQAKDEDIKPLSIKFPTRLLENNLVKSGTNYWACYINLNDDGTKTLRLMLLNALFPSNKQINEIEQKPTIWNNEFLTNYLRTEIEEVLKANRIGFHEGFDVDIHDTVTDNNDEKRLFLRYVLTANKPSKEFTHHLNNAKEKSRKLFITIVNHYDEESDYKYQYHIEITTDNQ